MAKNQGSYKLSRKTWKEGKDGNILCRIYKVLFSNFITSHSTNVIPPPVILMNKILRNKLSILNANLKLTSN